MPILGKNESLSIGLHGVSNRVGWRAEELHKIAAELDEHAVQIKRLRDLADMLGERLSDEIGDFELELIYKKWEERCIEDQDN